MNPRHELVNWDGAAGLTIDEAIDWLSHCHHSQQVSQNQVNKDVFLQHVVRRFRWVFALAGGQDRIVIAFLQKWLQFMSTYSKHNQTISSRGKRRHAWSLFLNKCCKRWWFIAWQSQTLIIQSHVIDLRQYTEWVISLYQYLHFWLEGQDDQVAVKSQPVLSDSETFSEEIHSRWTLLKKIINNGVKVQRNPLCAKKKYSSNEWKSSDWFLFKVFSVSD